MVLIFSRHSTIQFLPFAEFLILQIHKIRENVSVNAESWTRYRDGAVLLLAGERICCVEPTDIADDSKPHGAALARAQQPQAHLSEEE